MSLLERIKAHANPERTRRLEVPEWGDEAELDAEGEVVKPAKPLVITYAMVTLEDLSLITELDGQEWNKRASRVVVLKACDEGGNRLFKTGDAIEIRRVAAPEVVNRVAMAMLGRVSIDDAEKN
jgi:hypothetical protein